MKKKPVTIQSLKREIKTLTLGKGIVCALNEQRYAELNQAKNLIKKLEADLTIAKAREDNLRASSNEMLRKIDEVKELIYCEYITEHSLIDEVAWQEAKFQEHHTHGLSPEQFRMPRSNRQAKYFTHILHKVQSIYF
jgi:hypothetical protein